MIEVNSLTRYYGKTAAVDGVSFHIDDNEIVGLLGHNGAGKTTIMRMLSGYLEACAGSIHIDGVDLSTQPRIIQQQLGYLPESLPVYPEMLVADYLEYVATLKGVPSRTRLGAIQEALLATDLEQRALDPIGKLSRGFKQRVGVAQAILGRPRFLILDEPTNGLDPQQAEDMRQLIRRLARIATIILSTHIMQEVEAVCSRVLVLRNGRLALDARMDDLHRSSRLQLRTDDTVSNLAALLHQLPQILSVEEKADQEDNRVHFEMQLHAGVDINTASSNVSQCVIKAGASLFQLNTKNRDLSSVFREVNAHGD